MNDEKPNTKIPKAPPADHLSKPADIANALNRQIPEQGGQDGPDPTRYGDWEKGGRCTDF